MKNIRLILLATLTLAFATGNAQIKIEKRKHLKGYHVEHIKKADKPSDFKIKDGDRVTAQEVALMEQEVAKAQANVVILPVAESSFFQQAAPTSAPTENLVAANSVAKNNVSGFSFLRKGAGLVLSHKINIAKEKVQNVVPASKMAGPADIFAIIGFIFGILSVLSIFGGGFIFFGVIGLIFSLLGMDSSYGNFAYWGLILSIIGIVLGLIFVLGDLYN